MLTGLVLASVFGAFALPEFTRLSDALGMSGDGSGGGADDGSNDTADAQAPSDAPDLLTAPDTEDGDPAADDAPANESPEPVPNVPDTDVSGVDVSDMELSDAPDAPDTLPDPQEDGETDPGLADEQIPDVDPVAEGDLEMISWDAVPGIVEITDFDPEAQELALQVPENTTGYLTHDGDPDADPPVPPMLTFEVPDGAVELRFTDMEAVPVDAITVAAAGGDATGIAAMLLNDVAGTLPDGPDGPDGPDEIDDEVPPVGEDTPVLPDDPDAPTDPPENGELPDDDPIRPDAPDDAGPERFTGFDVETDVLQIQGDADAVLSVRPTDDGADAEVRMNDTLVAVVAAVPHLTVDAVQMVAPPV